MPPRKKGIARAAAAALVPPRRAAAETRDPESPALRQVALAAAVGLLIVVMIGVVLAAADWPGAAPDSAMMHWRCDFDRDTFDERARSLTLASGDCHDAVEKASVITSPGRSCYTECHQRRAASSVPGVVRVLCDRVSERSLCWRILEDDAQRCYIDWERWFAPVRCRRVDVDDADITHLRNLRLSGAVPRGRFSNSTALGAVSMSWLLAPYDTGVVVTGCVGMLVSTWIGATFTASRLARFVHRIGFTIGGLTVIRYMIVLGAEPALSVMTDVDEFSTTVICGLAATLALTLARQPLARRAAR